MCTAIESASAAVVLTLEGRQCAIFVGESRDGQAGRYCDRRRARVYYIVGERAKWTIGEMSDGGGIAAMQKKEVVKKGIDIAHD